MQGSRGLEDELAARILRHGPRPYDELVELALYEPRRGFYASGGVAGRRGDFITSPEVGPLFGAVLAKALEQLWTDLGRPDPFLVVEAGAGTGTLARTVAFAGPAFLPALTYVLVERSDRLRARHGEHLELTTPAFALGAGARGPGSGDGPRFVSVAELPAVGVTGVVVANELLDNLPFGVLERTSTGWDEVRIGLADDARLGEVVVPASNEAVTAAERFAPRARPGARIPLQHAGARWLRRALSSVERGAVLVIDYASTTAEMAERPQASWLRTYRGHGRGSSPLEDLGAQDVTVEVAVDQLAAVRAPASVVDQADFLREHGIDALVEEGRALWSARAHVGDLDAVRARSRIREAEALVDPAGLGGFRVLRWDC